MQIGFHELEDEVDIPVIVCLEDVVEGNYVLVATHVLEEHDFTKCALCICRILERVEYLLQSDRLLVFLVERLPNNPVGTLR